LKAQMGFAVRVRGWNGWDQVTSEHSYFDVSNSFKTVMTVLWKMGRKRVDHFSKLVP